MRVLHDENVDRRLRRLFESEYEVVTVSEQGWSGMKNGELLRLAEQEFDALVTMDRNIQYQQQLINFDLVYVLITARSNRRQDVEPVMPEVNRAFFNDEQVEYLLVGAYALAAHGLPRATGDIDLWVKRSPENAKKIMGALADSKQEVHRAAEGRGGCTLA